MQVCYSTPRDLWLSEKATRMRRHDQLKRALETNLADIHAVEEAEALRIGRIAIDAGLADVRTTKAQLKKEFSALADSFPKRSDLALVAARKIAAKRLAARHEAENCER